VPIAAVSNVDNLAVGFAFGMRDMRIAMSSNLVIAAVTMAGTAAAMTSGHAISQLMSLSLAAAAGSLIIIAMGVGTVLASLRAPCGQADDPVKQRSLFDLGDAGSPFRGAGRLRSASHCR
jgi:putative Mn2+ efflux pump MntP